MTVNLSLAAGSAETVADADQGMLIGGSETIMLVDDVLIRELAVAILRPLGYKTLVVSTGNEALEVSRFLEGTIHAVLTDVVMPKMHGKDLAESLQREQPGIIVIFMSGYTDDVIARHGVLDRNLNFVQKPITASILTRKLRSVLDKNKAA